MTIARRLLILLSIPLVTLVGLGVFMKIRLDQVEERGRFVAEKQITSLKVAATITQTFEEMRADARSLLLAENSDARSEPLKGFERRKAELARLVRQYEDTLTSDERDRRLTTEVRERTREWVAGAEHALALAAAGDKKAGVTHLTVTLAPLGAQVGSLMSEWLQHNEELASEAGAATVVTIQKATRALLIAVLVAVALSGVLGFATYRRIVRPLHALERSVESIARGDFDQEVPFTGAADETGALARSVEILKGGRVRVRTREETT